MPRLNAADTQKRADSDAGRDFLETLARGLSIIELFTGERRSMSLAEMAKLVDLPRATVRRTMHTLVTLDYAQSDGRQFSLRPGVLKLAAAFLGSNPVASVLKPACEELAERIRLPVGVGVMEGGAVIYIARADPTLSLTTTLGLGIRLPLFSSALGRVLLAALPDKELDSVLKARAPAKTTQFSVTDTQELRKHIRKARIDGYALVVQETLMGYQSIAVPIHAYDGRVVAALHVGASLEGIATDVFVESYLPELLDIADRMQSQLVV